MKLTVENVFYTATILGMLLGLPVFAYSTFQTKDVSDGQHKELVERLNRIELILINMKQHGFAERR